jgi:magnesium chelatase accessory protein
MADTSGALVWDRDGRDWPNRQSSHFVRADGIVWHVQQFGQGPPALLLHGTGASTHSWAWLAPHLRDRFTLIAADLPGHAFTEALPRGEMTLPGIAAALAALLAELGVSPRLAVGHSAGAAILAQMALDGAIAPDLIVALNGALSPFKGAASHVFPAMAKLLFVNPLASRFFVWRAGRTGAVERLIEGTGSQIPARSLAIYQRLFLSPAHVAGALAMMANWDLRPVAEALPRLGPRLLQIVGSNDRAIAPDEAFQLAKRVPGAIVALLRGPGHLIHEEDPRKVAELIMKAAAEVEAEAHASIQTEATAGVWKN